MTYSESFFLVMPLLTLVTGFFIGWSYAHDEIRSKFKFQDPDKPMWKIPESFMKKPDEK